jgi:ribose transport system permease protein
VNGEPVVVQRQSPHSVDTAPPVDPAPGRTWLWFVRRHALAGLLALATGTYATWGATAPVFATAANVRNILASQAVLAVLGLGLVVVLVAGQFDLSIGTIAGLASVMAAAAYADWRLPLWVGVLVGLGVGALAGALNGFVVAVLGVHSLVATLGTASVMVAVVTWYTGGQSIVGRVGVEPEASDAVGFHGVPDSLTRFGSGTWLGVPRMCYVVVCIAAAVYFLLEHTVGGRRLHAIGANRRAARLLGIRVRRAVFGSFVLSGLLAGVAGLLLLAYSGAGNPQVGPNLTLTALAAAFVGAAAFRPGQFNVPGTLVAIYFIAVNITGLQYAGVPPYINDLFTGVALVLAVVVSGARLGWSATER